ncbi:ribosomal protein S18 acetylase RimI-like enzyme [Arthrobacter stackebrandtii]|uniref:Ribosomal protein S18 acetylase RimI-like enzyme n=1 Tax=Arthrobacter stackebrandtii TaxID=272161 RepID=A0ABS4YTW3_9MICC|nr:ribosomal protein S18 acetylase RimI-like enzyme [Arthrobacter stackebrandtii]
MSGKDEVSSVKLWLDALAARDGEVDSESVGARAREKFNEQIVRFAVLGRGVDGFALTTNPDWGVARLEMLAISPHTSIRGGGRALLTDAISHAGRAGFHRFELQVRDGNSKAIGLYESAGLKQEGVGQKHPLGGRPMLTFSLSLAVI